MPENNTHSTEDAAEIQEIRNYVAYQGIPIEVRAAAEGGEDSRTIGGYAVKYNTPVVDSRPLGRQIFRGNRRRAASTKV